MESELKAAEESLSFWQKCAKFIREVFTWEFFVETARTVVTVLVIAFVTKRFNGVPAAGGVT